MARKITRGNAMNRQEKKKYLRGYQNVKSDIKKLEDEYETIFTEATRIVPMLTGMPSSNVKDDRVLKYIMKLTEIQKRLTEKKKKLSCIENEINNLRPFHRHLITQIDLNHVPIRIVAKQISRDEQSIKKMHNRIVDKMFEER